MELYCISISHKTADISVRRNLAFPEKMQRRFMSELVCMGNAVQCAALCTCNRTEIYFCGEEKACEDVKYLLSKYGQTDVDLLLPHIRTYKGDRAILHLFRVACGIESMVVGEDEILGQTKTAYLTAKVNGTVSYELNIIFQSAISCAKKIKTRTALSRTSVSTATLAANEAAKLGEHVNVLVIGATGKIGSTVLKNLTSHKNVAVTATLRQHNNDIMPASYPRVALAKYSERYSLINRSDCIISATSSPHYTITYHGLKDNLYDSRRRLFIDLAVPPDIDSDIERLKGVKLIGIDYFERLARENNALKLDSVESAKQIIAAEADELKKELDFHDFLPFAENVGKAIADKSFDELLYRLKSELNSQQLKAVLETLKKF